MQQFKDELAEARPEALLGTRRRFLTLGRSRGRARLQHAPAGRGERPGALARGVSVHARRRVRRSAAGLGRALDAAGARRARPVRRHAVHAGRRGVGAGGRRALHADRADRARPSPAGVRAQRPRRRAGPGARPRVLLPLRRRRRAQPDRPHPHRARPAATPRCKFAFVSCQSWHARLLHRLQAPGGRGRRRRPAPRRLHLRVRDRPGRRPAQHADPAPRRRLATESLDQYRQRYALYKTDPDLQAAHAAAPFVVTWDDHEVVNNYADSTTPGRAEADSWSAARTPTALLGEHAAAAAAAAKGPDLQLYRRFRYGDLVEFNVLDTRQYRSAQVTGDARCRRRRARSWAPSRSSGCWTG